MSQSAIAQSVERGFGKNRKTQRIDVGVDAVANMKFESTKSNYLFYRIY